MTRSLPWLLALSALTLGCDFIIPPLLESEEPLRIGDVAETPSGTRWVLEPYYEPWLALRRYEGDRVVETVPLPEVEGLRAFYPLADDLIFVGRRDYWAGLFDLWMWDGASWTEVPDLPGVTQPVARCAPVLTADGTVVIARSTALVYRDPAGEWSFAALPEAIVGPTAITPSDDGLLLAGQTHTLGDTVVVEIAADGSARELATLHLSGVASIEQIDGRMVVVGSRDYSPVVAELDGTERAVLTDGVLLATATATDGALFLLLSDYGYARSLVARVDSSGFEYVGEIQEEGSAYPAATRMVADETGGVWLYGAGVYHLPGR